MIEPAQKKVKQRARKRLVLAVLVAFFVLYGDIFAFKIPIFAFLVCPLLFLFFIIVLLLKKTGIKEVLLQCFFGPLVTFLAVTVISPILGELHDQWILREIREWGSELRLQKSTTGIYPVSETKFFHGYHALFINKEPIEPAVIYFTMFGQIRQSYSVRDDHFLEKWEI